MFMYSANLSNRLETNIESCVPCAFLLFAVIFDQVDDVVFLIRIAFSVLCLRRSVFTCRNVFYSGCRPYL